MRYSKYSFLLCSVACCLAHASLFSANLVVNVANDGNISGGGSFTPGPNTGDLRGVLNYINQNPGNHSVTFNLGAPNNTITIGAMLPIINLNAANTVTINGANSGNRIVINGSNTHRGFFVRQGDVTFQSLTIEDVKAEGGSGGGGVGGGGGMGAGAALFVDQAAVTLVDIEIGYANAIGGNGGISNINFNTNTAGGGGLGGNGGDSRFDLETLAIGAGGGGIGGTGGNGGTGKPTNSGMGGGGGINCGASHLGTGGAASGSSGSPGLPGGGLGGNPGGAAQPAGGGGGASGGGGGGTDPIGGGGAGGGGVGGSDGSTANGGTGGNGGFGGGGGAGGVHGGVGGFGGGGGGGGTGFGGTGVGGNGGFGGGGGSGFVIGGSGGFGGGGGGFGTPFGNGSSGSGGVGGGVGGPMTGGGGAGFGGALFINSSGSLIIKGSFNTEFGTNGSQVVAGASGGGGSSPGAAAGADAFFMTGASITLDPDGFPIIFNQSIADDSLASFVGAPSGVTKGNATGVVLNIGNVASSGGTVALTKANTYSGGTILHKGSVAIQNNDSLGSGPLTFAQSGTTLAAAANNLTLSNPVQLIGNGTISIIDRTMTITSVISGAGSLIKSGTGTLILTGGNNYSGGTTVSAGTLQGDTSSLQGNILNNGAVIFNQTAAGSYNSAISGSGSLNKIGTEQLRLTGHNTYIGPTTISAGMLTLDGSLTSSVTTLPGTSLNGSGSISGDVIIGGLLGPADMIGTLEVVGNVTFQTGSTFQVQAEPSTAQVLDVDASGNITIEPGATILIIPTPATYRADTGYNIATAGESGGVVNGTFDNVINTYPLITATILYQHTSAPTLEQTALDINQISLSLNFAPFSTLITQGNPGAVAASLDNFTPVEGSDMDFVIEELYFLGTLEAVTSAFNQMQPSLLNNISLAQQNSSLFVSSAFTKHTSDLRQTRSPCTDSGDKRWQVWGDGSVDWARQRGNHQNVGFHAKTELGAGGFDYRITRHFYLGVLGAYTHLSVHCKDHLAKGAVNTYYTGLYSSLLYPCFFANLSVVGNFSDYHSKRRIQFGTINRQPHGYHHGYGVTAHLDLGASLPAERRAQCYPYGALDYVYQHEKGYTETKAQSLNNNIRSRNTALLRSELGLQGRFCQAIGNNVFIPSAKLGWVYESRFQGKKLNARLVDVPNRYTVVGLYPNRSLLATGASLTGVFGKQKAHLSVTYEGLFGSGYISNAGNISLNLQF